MLNDFAGIVATAGPLISSYGYLAVAALVMVEDFGIPVPGETTLATAAFFASRGQLNIFGVFFVALVAAIIGDNIGFAIGSVGGRPLLERFGRYLFLTPKRLDKAEVYFRDHGGKIVVVARFIDGLRQLNGIIAGISDMPWSRFVLYNVLGAALWAATWSAIGYYAGHYIARFTQLSLVIAAVLAVSVISYFVIKHKKAAASDT